MAAIRFSKRGRKISVADKAPRDRPSRVEKAVTRHLESRFRHPETTPDRMTWPHWAGCKSNPGHHALNSHGEIASPYLKSLKKSKD